MQVSRSVMMERAGLNSLSDAICEQQLTEAAYDSATIVELKMYIILLNGELLNQKRAGNIKMVSMIALDIKQVKEAIVKKGGSVDVGESMQVSDFKVDSTRVKK